jgi:hypothetical protein
MPANFSGLKGVDAIFVGSLDSQEKRFIVQATANAAYAAPGYLLFYHDKALLAQRFDPFFSIPTNLWDTVVTVLCL